MSRILEDLEFDSLDYATLMLSCEARCGMTISERKIDWAEVKTLDALAGLFAQQ